MIENETELFPQLITCNFCHLLSWILNVLEMNFSYI